MVFSSIPFLCYFFPLFFVLYYLADKKYKNAIILIGSIYFYSCGAPRFIFVLLATTFIDFFVVRFMNKATRPILKKTYLILSLSLNLSLLFYFKYYGFFIDNLNLLSQQLGCKPFIFLKVIMPVGISFYTFETVTYVIDVYRGIHPPLRRFWDYQLYIILFPKLIAGPIIKFHDFADQISGHLAQETVENKLRGLFRFFIGLGKKVLIANILGRNADLIFNIPHDQLTTYTAWVGALSYTFQIYFDFSGYSDMAIGMGQMMGFRFPENFNNPYTAVSVTDFWRRWHITLGAWMREYLYIPLGGNRVKSKRRLFFNLWIVFLLSGLWHGAAWGFIFWGAYHGFFLVVERLFLGKYIKRTGAFACIYTFFVVTIGWVFFRIENFRGSVGYLKHMFGKYTGNPVWTGDNEFITIFFLAFFFSFLTLSKWGKNIEFMVFHSDLALKYYFIFGFLSIIICVIATGRLTVSSFNPFIYYRF